MNNRRILRRDVPAIAITALSGVVFAAAALNAPALSVLEHRLSDFFIRAGFVAAQPLPSSDVVVIAIDDASRRRISEPLAYWQPHVAAVVRALGQARAKAIGIDLLFSANDARALTESRRLAQALSESASNGTPVVLGHPLNTPLPPSPPYLLAATTSPRSLGYMDIPADGDDVVRRFEPCRPDPPDVALSLGARLALAGRKEEPSCDGATFRTAGLYARLDHQRSLTIPFEALPEPGRLPFANVLEMANQGRLAELERQVAGRLVLIGSYELQDRHLTPRNSPASERTPGVDIHAAITQSLYSGRVLAVSAPWLVWTLSLALALASSTVALCFRWQVSLAATVAVMLSGVAPMVIARGQGAILPAMPLLASALWAGLCAGVYRYHTEAKGHRRLREQFGRFVSPEVVEQIIRDGVELGGTRRFVTILFADVRGFTTMSERMSPEVLVVQLNEYLEAMTDVIISEGGYLDKFIGDGILAVFGAPVTQRDAAWHAVLAATKMLGRLAELNVGWRQQGRSEWSIGVGLHSGDAVVGNIGSWRKLDYTVVGDTVNTASRIESLTKTSIQRYNAHILLSGATVEELERWDHYCDVFAMDIEQLKGKSQLTQLFVLRGLYGAGRKGGSAHA